MTNEDFYTAVNQFANAHEIIPPLETYLRSLWQLVAEHGVEPPSAEKMLIFLKRAYTHTPPPFDAKWNKRKFDYDKRPWDFSAWEDLILWQIVDLRRMGTAGTLENPYKFFGADSPSGSRWYNFDPVTYLECGVAGAFGAGVAGREPISLDDITWDDWIALLECGRVYE